MLGLEQLLPNDSILLTGLRHKFIYIIYSSFFLKSEIIDWLGKSALNLSRCALGINNYYTALQSKCILITHALRLYMQAIHHYTFAILKEFMLLPRFKIYPHFYS